MAGRAHEPALVCPACGRGSPALSASARAAGSRWCSTRRTRRRARPSATHRARKVKPQLTEGELVRVAGARNQAEGEFIQGLLLEEGVPSMLRRSAGFDVPDFLAAGPRDVMVPQSGAQTAREVLLERRARSRIRRAERARGRARRACWPACWARWRWARWSCGWRRCCCTDPGATAAPARRARCERQAPSVWTSGRPPNAWASAARGPGDAAGRRTAPRRARPPRGRAGRSPCRRAAWRRAGPGGSSGGRPRAGAARSPAGRDSVWPPKTSGRRPRAATPSAAPGAARAAASTRADRGCSRGSHAGRRAQAALSVQHLARARARWRPAPRSAAGASTCSSSRARPARDVASRGRRGRQPGQRQQRVGQRRATACCGAGPP